MKKYFKELAIGLYIVRVAGLKNKWLGTPAALVIGFLLQAGPAAAQTNILTNPGFETGDTTGWFAFGTPTLTAENTVVHSGNYACAVTSRTATYMGAAQSLIGLLQSGQTYNVSAWVMLEAGTSQTMHLTMQETVGSTMTYTEIASGTVTSSGWTQLSGTYMYNPSGSDSALNFYIEMPSSATNSYYLDDAAFIEAAMPTNPPISGVSVVNWNNVFQRIDGFGASSAWNGNWNTAEEQLLFSTNLNISYQSGTYNGVGLSLLRNHIVFASTTSAGAVPSTIETAVMQAAQSYGARVWSTPWTPAAGFKSTNDIYDSNYAPPGGTNGGSYLGNGNNITNINYASQLANYVASMKNTYGVNLYAISVQNEPDADVTTYEACQWTGTQIHDFVTNLYSALAAQGLSSAKIIIPESQNWSANTGLFTPTLSDPAAAADVSIVADHDYVANNDVGDQTPPPALSVSGKAEWETEVALLSGSDSSIANGVYYAQRIYLYMTQANANAYHYWWLVASGEGNEGLLDTSATVTKRLFTFGQYSRFVRPNFYRINATSSQQSELISAYKDSASPAFAIVVVNTNTATGVFQTINLTNFTATSVTPWITTSTLSLAPQTAVTLTNSSFTYFVPAMSVVTFVGQGSTPPTISSVPNQTVNVGVTLQITNTASDSDSPPNTLTFSSANTFPGNATVNSSSGVFSWRPHVSHANTTNVIQVQVTDSGSSLSATNSFDVIVNAVTNPVIGGINLSAGQISMAVNGPQGPDYTLFTSSNLLNWQALFTTNSPVMPFTFIAPNLITNPAEFYHFQIGP
jgi:glucuronoarabinoxylan endo-1,4-beta-xylanase